MTNHLIPQEKISPMEAATRLVQLEKQIKLLEEHKKVYKQRLLEVMREHDTYSLKTGSYTLSRIRKITPKVLSVDRLKEELEKREIPYYLQEVFAPSMDEVFKKLAQENQDIYENGIPGLAISETEFVMVRLIQK